MKNGVWMPDYYAGYVWWENRWYSFESPEEYEEYIEEASHVEM